MARHVKKRTISTRLVESGEVINFRIVAEMVAKNIVEGVHNDKTRTI
jgi:hypothetical protein